jgi:hypothetical protein
MVFFHLYLLSPFFRFNKNISKKNRKTKFQVKKMGPKIKVLYYAAPELMLVWGICRISARSNSQLA